MADLAKIMSELVQAIRKKGGTGSARELTLKATPEGSAVEFGGGSTPFGYVFQDIGEFDRARQMLGAAFPDVRINQSHRLGDPSSPMFPQGAGTKNVRELISLELPDFSPEEVIMVERQLGEYMRKTGNTDPESSLMNMLDDPEFEMAPERVR